FHYLGLVWVTRIMERFDGSITLRSEQQVGTRVRLLFRVASGESNGAEYSCSRDDELLASNIQSYLERKGNEVQVQHSAEAALESLSVFNPDVVLTDNSLPGMNGL